jgi:ketosteroid isomerase-like protein
MAHRNEVLLRKTYDAFGNGDMDTVLGVFADDIQWHEFGGSPLGGDYKGKEEVLGFFGKLMELSGRTFHLEVQDVLGNDRHVVALVQERAERDGKILAIDAVHVWQVQNDTAVDFSCYPADPKAFDDFFS